MAKVMVCDIHKHKGVLVECNTYLSVKGKPHLRLDYCKECKPTIPKDMTEYKKLVARVNGLDENAYLDTLKTTKNCKYCGKDNGTIYPDFLCKDCRETFGHTLYSEL